MQFIANRFRISSRFACLSMPSTAFFVILMARSKSAITTGKLNTAIKILLLLALEAILDIRLSDAENPKEVRNKVRKKTCLS
jgi:hypothetical protein